MLDGDPKLIESIDLEIDRLIWGLVPRFQLYLRLGARFERSPTVEIFNIPGSDLPLQPPDEAP
jgi:hypothetical protein